MKCDKCDSAYINGHFCHEHGCPNTYQHYDKEEDVWVEIFTCRECGFELPIGEDTCDCTEPVEDDDEEENDDVIPEWQREANTNYYRSVLNLNNQ